jgi:selenocysteine-specific elongation factor
MRVIATAGHVDHGKSTLVRALTGMEPDRWAEERRRGMTIDLGFAWTRLANGEPIAFVDVPGHQRFVTNMLAGVGSVPAVMLVVAADEGWRRQSSEHLDAIDALQIVHGLLVVTRADLVGPEQVVAVISDARARLSRSSLAGVEAVAVSGLTGQGLPELRDALGRLVAGLPQPVETDRVRLWVDRCFTVAGAGTVVTGTLGAGRLAVGDQLQLKGRTYPVRGLQALGEALDPVTAVARVAVNLRGLDRDRVTRGDCLLTPDAWSVSDRLDVRLDPLLAEPSGDLVLHIGSAAIPARVRLLGADVGRLSLAAPIPVRAGDRAVLRDPGQQSVIGGVLVIDPDPPALNRRGAARARGAELSSGVAGTLAAQVRRRGAVSRVRLAMLGFSAESEEVLDRAGWLVDPATWQRWLDQLGRAVDEHARAEPHQPRLPAEAARRAVGVPDQALLRELAAEAGLDSQDGRIGRPGVGPSLGSAAGAMAILLQRLGVDPFAAPEHDELAELGLGVRELATAAKAGLLLRLAPELVLGADAVERAVPLLARLGPEFSTSQARAALGTTRRIAVPLLEHLDLLGITVRLDANHRALT